MSLQKLKERALANSEVMAEYEKLENEINLVDQLLTMRTKAGLTQEEIAKKMHTQKSNISRLEKGGANPNWFTLLKYAQACGFDLTLKLQEKSL